MPPLVLHRSIFRFSLTRTSATLFSPPAPGLTFCPDVENCTPRTAAVPGHNIRARLASCEDRFRISQKGEHPMSEVNKTIVRSLFEEVWNKGNLSVADELFTPNCEH